MESVCLRLDKTTSKRIEEDMKVLGYGTKTDFIREAIRDKLKDNEKAKAWKRLFAMRGILKGKERFKTDEEWHDWRSNEGSRELMDYFDKKFSQK